MPRTSDPTARQQRAQERREEAAATLAAGVHGATLDPAALAAHLEFCALFRSYSTRNKILLAQQAKERGTTAAHVKGYRAWQDVGRQVRKGERGYMLFAPVVRKLTGEDAREAGVPDGTRAVVAFRVASVFAIEQTDVIPGHEQTAPVYVSPIPELVGDDFDELRGDLERVAAALGLTLTLYAPHERSADGFYSEQRRTIGLKLASANQQAATLAHELAHALAHDGRRAAGISKEAAEVQAEGAAYLACYVLGLDTAAASLPYLRTWATGETEEERQGAVLSHLGAIERIGWRLVELVEAAREGSLSPEAATAAAAESRKDAAAAVAA